MPPSQHRRGYGYRRDSHSLSPNSETIFDGLRPRIHQARAKLMRLWNSPTERARLVAKARRIFYQTIPWPPVVEILLVVLWISQLNWGEQSSFNKAVAQCSWSNWEAWPADASPYRIALVADPQLVDPHTYPGRPWPLSTLTIKHTDQYIRRSFSTILNTLHPSSVLFLGDLFDGGREWSTLDSTSPEQQYRKYGDKYWLGEYARFGRIFVDPWIKESAMNGHPQARFEASMPGNHDLGFANGVQIPVRDRFARFFGNVNHIQILGNHTVVSVDSVSLSAKGTQNDNRAVWEPTYNFLNDAKRKKSEVVQRELRTRAGQKENQLLRHEVIDADAYQSHSLSGHAEEHVVDFPTILLTHVPLYRPPGTPCGPLREKYPPSQTDASGKSLESDDANAIKVQSGYQYQNVLHPDISKDLIDKIGGVEHVFSGDDHDYCELVHRGYISPGGGIREITVKSISWAMGVRHPGFLLLSLWNPVLNTSGPLAPRPDAGTLQSHLCILPDQLGIFLHYLKLLVFTAIALAINAIVVAQRFRYSDATRANDSLLPVDEHDSHGLTQFDNAIDRETMSCSSSAHSSESSSTSLRPSGNRPRASQASPTPGAGYQYHKGDKPGYAYDSGVINAKASGPGGTIGKGRAILTHFMKSIRLVALGGFMWYIWLMRSF